jgi:hypothetical protein
VKVPALHLTVLAFLLTAGLGQASPTARWPTLSYEVPLSVSDYDRFAGPLGGGICLGGKRITDLKEDHGAAWSPGGRRQAFYRATGTLTADVFVVDANGARLRNLTRRTAQHSWHPDWSPDGRRILFIASGPRVERLMTMRPDGSDRRQVPGMAFDPNRQLGEAHWTPDGRSIGYALNDGIHVVRADGSESRLLIAGGASFDWSPDGRRIAFTLEGDLAIANSDGSDTRFVTRTPKLVESGADWSPDGSRMLYTATFEPEPGSDELPRYATYLADTNGRNRRVLRTPPEVFGGTPAWRPAAAPVKGARRCTLLGTRHAEVLVGTAKADLIYAGRGNDVVRGRGGDDVIVGDEPYTARPGNDVLLGGPGRDFIDSADERRDLVDGGPGRDRALVDPRDRVRSIETRG